MLISQMIVELFKDMRKEEIKISIVDEKSLKQYVTQKDEKKKDLNFSRMPNIGRIDVNTYFNIQEEKEAISRFGSILDTCGNDSYKIAYVTDFKPLKTIGIGPFSKIILVEHLSSGNFCSMKVINKEILIKNDIIENILLEKRLLSDLEHPFLINLLYFFQTPEKIYFSMPFVPGGDLYFHLNKIKKFNEEVVRFICAQVALVIDYIHNYGVIYRNLKPENILLDSDGYIKLIDFGFSKKIHSNNKTYSICGTPEYMSPEIIKGEGHNKLSDWWSFGILLFELLTGTTPFVDNNKERLFELILNSEILFDKYSYISLTAIDLIEKLLMKDPYKRIGSTGGLSQLQDHSFFTGINFESLLNKDYKSLYLPQLYNIKDDVQYFDESFTKIPPILNENISLKDQELIRKNQDRFNQFI